jgi:starvation-inducible DNA-binding protein
MQTNIGIEQGDLQKVISHLQRILSDEAVLYVKTLNYHWNVEGRDFDALHLFFKKQYEDLFEIVDLVAERIRSLGGKPLASMAEYLKSTRLSEDPVTDKKRDQQMLKQLLLDHETVIRHVRQDIVAIQDTYHDIGTGNLITDSVLEKHEKMAWMLRAFVSES